MKIHYCVAALVLIISLFLKLDRLEMLIKEHLGECEYSFEKDLNGFDRFLFISLK